MGSEIPDLDIDWDYPLTDEDLRAIDSAFCSAAAPKRKALSARDDDDGGSAGSPIKTRRLPDSLFVFKLQQNNDNTNNSTFSLSPCFRNRFSCGSSSSHLSTFQEIKFGGRIIYGRTLEEVERAAKELLDFVEAKKRKEGQCILGLDIEWRASFRRGVAPGKAAVMQICGDNSCCYVLHIIHSGIPKSLKTLLEDCTSQKVVGVCIANDAAKVMQDYNVSINSLGDLSDLANQKLSGDPKKWSLSSLAEMLICRKYLLGKYCIETINITTFMSMVFNVHGILVDAAKGQVLRCLHFHLAAMLWRLCRFLANLFTHFGNLPKPSKIRLGNWEVDVLSMEQTKYASTDAYVSWYLYQVLKNHPDPAGKTSAEMVAK